MADWGTGARSKEHEAPPVLKWRWKDFICSKCGRMWMFRYLYDSDLKQVQDEFGNVLCTNCRSKLPKRKPTPPPPELQIMIDEVLNTKK